MSIVSKSQQTKVVLLLITSIACGLVVTATQAQEDRHTDTQGPQGSARLPAVSAKPKWLVVVAQLTPEALAALAAFHPFRAVFFLPPGRLLPLSPSPSPEPSRSWRVQFTLNLQGLPPAYGLGSPPYVPLPLPPSPRYRVTQHKYIHALGTSLPAISWRDLSGYEQQLTPHLPTSPPIPPHPPPSSLIFSLSVFISLCLTPTKHRQGQATRDLFPSFVRQLSQSVVAIRPLVYATHTR